MSGLGPYAGCGVCCAVREHTGSKERIHALGGRVGDGIVRFLNAASSRPVRPPWGPTRRLPGRDIHRSSTSDLCTRVLRTRPLLPFAVCPLRCRGGGAGMAAVATATGPAAARESESAGVAGDGLANSAGCPGGSCWARPSVWKLAGRASAGRSASPPPLECRLPKVRCRRRGASMSAPTRRRMRCCSPGPGRSARGQRHLLWRHEVRHQAGDAPVVERFQKPGGH